MKKFKRAFTIVELVIVIAVIAILAAVLIPTFSSIIRKANVSNDTQLVRNMNTALVVDSTINGKHKTMQSALDAAFDAGYDLSKINARANQNEILWDSVNDVFCYLSVENGAEAIEYIPNSIDGEPLEAGNYKLWRIVKKTDKINYDSDYYLNGYSVYLADDFVVTNGSVEIDGKGFDAGNNPGVTSVSYTNTGENGRDVVIRTNGGTLTIGSSTAVAEGKITHYGTLDEAIVYTTNNSFHTHGKISSMDLKAGKAVAEDKGYVALVKAAEGTEIQEVDSGVFYIPSNAVVSNIDSTVASSIGYVSDGDSYVVDTNTEAGQKRTQTLASTAYEIGSKFDLIAFRDAVNAGNDFAGLTVKLTSDIDMLGYQWLTPIGIANNNFAGTFDGQLHTISNLSNNGVATTEEVYISSTETTGNAFGLFGIVKGDVTIKNFDITVNAVYSQGEKWAAVVDEAGESNTHLTLENINVYGYLSGFDKVAGLIAESPTRKTNSSLVINNCTNYATVVGGARVAGILSGGGKQTNVRNAIIMTNVHNKGNITCSNQNTTRPEAYNVAAGICAHVNSTMAYAQEGTWFEKYPEGWTANMTLTNVTNEGTLSGMITADQLWYVFDYDSLTDDKLVIEYRLTSIGNGISSSAKEYLKEFDSHNILAGLAYETSETMVCRTAGGRQYSSIQYALAKNQSIILNCDATLDFDISCSRTIDLDGHTLTITEMQSINGGSLTFKNGTIVFENKGHFHLENYNGSSNLYLNNIAINEAGKDIIKVYGNHERNDTHLVTFDDQCNIKGNAKLYNRATALYFNEELVNQDSLNNGLFYCGE